MHTTSFLRFPEVKIHANEKVAHFKVCNILNLTSLSLSFSKEKNLDNEKVAHPWGVHFFNVHVIILNFPMAMINGMERIVHC